MLSVKIVNDYFERSVKEWETGQPFPDIGPHEKVIEVFCDGDEMKIVGVGLRNVPRWVTYTNSGEILTFLGEDAQKAYQYLVKFYGV